MRDFIGSILVIIGICAAFFVGFWLMFIGGIVQVVTYVRAENLDSLKIGIGIARILLSLPAGFFAGWIFIKPGMYLGENY